MYFVLVVSRFYCVCVCVGGGGGGGQWGEQGHFHESLKVCSFKFHNKAIAKLSSLEISFQLH